ncbi:MAG: DUF1566 domain-containing protein, partial [Deltaproteobacteria bacterium]|nr:DUF1566 domain-containing protein [Deltaproteobacteria bacterium]
NQTVAAGYWSSENTVLGDAKLEAGNIKNGVQIFDVTGSYTGEGCTGDATTADVLADKTFSNSSSTGLTGERHGGCICTGTLYADRWCDNGNGTVTDLDTCLIWLKKADWGGSKQWRNFSTDCSSPNYTCYDDAHTRAGVLKAADYDWLTDGSVEGDWRLPTKTELKGLVNGVPTLRCPSGTCNVYCFTDVAATSYWSSSTYAGNSDRAWLVGVHNGYVGYFTKDAAIYVWPVRSGN